MTPRILQKIRSDRERTLAATMSQRPIEAVQAAAEACAFERRFIDTLTRPGGPHLIAELKKASPSAGLIRADFNPPAIARAYADGGASALSVLTEPTFFQGSLDTLRQVRGTVDLPLLRKDFIFHRYQLLEAVEAGADAVLLIVGMLAAEELRALHVEADALGLNCLVEVHDAAELTVALGLDLSLVGINNRDLNTMTVDIDTTRRLLPAVPEGVAVVSESGIQSREDVRRLGEAGVSAVLVGESLMRQRDVRAAAASLLND